MSSCWASWGFEMQHAEAKRREKRQNCLKKGLEGWTIVGHRHTIGILGSHLTTLFLSLSLSLVWSLLLSASYYTLARRNMT